MQMQEMYAVPGNVMPAQSSPMLGYSGPPVGVKVPPGSATSSTVVGAPTVVNGVPMQAVGTYMPKGFVPVTHSPSAHISPTPVNVNYQPIMSPQGGLYNSTGGLNSNPGSRKSAQLYSSNPGVLYGSQSGRDSVKQHPPQQPGSGHQQVVGSYFMVPQQQQQVMLFPESSTEHADRHHSHMQEPQPQPQPVPFAPYMVPQMVSQQAAVHEAEQTNMKTQSVQRHSPAPPQTQQPVVMQQIAIQQPMVLQQRPVSGLPPPSAPNHNKELLHPKEHEDKRYMAMHMVPVVQPQVSMQYVQMQAQKQVSTSPVCLMLQECLSLHASI